MNLPELVAGAVSATTVTASAPVQHLCPFKDEVDNGTVTIIWTCNTRTIEMHSLAKYLSGFATFEISHEELTTVIADDLIGLGEGITVHSVTARFTTAGIDVEVTRVVHDHSLGT